MEYIVGAYATAPSLGGSSRTLEREYYDYLIKSIPEIRGLEIPFWGESLHQFGDDFLLNNIRNDWQNVLSCIPASVCALKENPNIGLASNDEAARLESVKIHKRANQAFHKICDRTGNNSIIAVQLATAPSAPVESVSASVDSLRKSLDELLSLEWYDAKITIEHCDSYSGNHPYVKGFMALDEEIKILRTLANDHDNLGVTLNWARSAIEGRSASHVIEHIKQARQANLLLGFIFSGTSKYDKNYGEWSDLHMPFAKIYDIKSYEENSLLTEKNIRETLLSIDLAHLDYIGVKLLSQPIEDSTIERRVDINKDALLVLNRIIGDIEDEKNAISK